MPPLQPASPLAGSFRLFMLGGISVYVHWSWLVVGYLELQFRTNYYQSQVWNVLEYLTLFGIVLLHEFGHALACRQVGGEANQIVLWPLGGIAFVNPPPRPGVLLRSIVAGPLVNLVLIPVTVGIWIWTNSLGLQDTDPDVAQFVLAVMDINLGLFLFNMLPVYPLDGGQILQALLWFVIGRAKALLAVSIVGMVAAAAVIILAVVMMSFLAVGMMSFWIGLTGVFVAFRSWAGFQQARLLALLENAPRHEDAACPYCHAHPLQGDFWRCGECGTRFDPFSHHAECPGCRARSSVTRCPECQREAPIDDWLDRRQSDEFQRWRD